MPRPRGRPLPQEHRDRIRASMLRYQQERRSWAEIGNCILEAANAGDTELASDLLHDYLDSRHAEADADEETNPVQEMGREMDDLFAETRRIQAVRRSWSCLRCGENGIAANETTCTCCGKDRPQRGHIITQPYRPGPLGRHIANRMEWQLTETEARKLGREMIALLREAGEN